MNGSRTSRPKCQDGLGMTLTVYVCATVAMIVLPFMFRDAMRAVKRAPANTDLAMRGVATPTNTDVLERCTGRPRRGSR
jgi:hypothetical protein